MSERRNWRFFAILAAALLILGAVLAGLSLPQSAVLAEGETDEVMPAPEMSDISESGALTESEATFESSVTEFEDAAASESAPEPEITPEPGSAPAAETSQSEEDLEGMEIPAIYQSDYREPMCRINGVTRTVASSGCGATCVSMVISYLTGDGEQTPETLFRSAVERGEYRGWGLTHETLSELLSDNGVQSEWISNSADAIEEALREGKPVIAHVGPGTFTNNGHYLVLRGITDDGQVLLNDPASPERTEMTYPIQTVVKQARREDSFMVCWTDEPLPESTPVPSLIFAANALRAAKTKP